MSNALQRDLTRLTTMFERGQARAPRTWAQRFHLMPPCGWLNDPNGLYQQDGVFHAYFQYAPFDVAGGVKMWGHATSRDLLTWEHDGAVLYPDAPFDCHGVYSGSALVHDGRVTMLYTGSVKLPDPDGSFDYVSTGRESNTVAVDTADGSTFGEKRLLMTNADYPADLTCHVRDPKAWRADAACGAYLMVQGARRRVDAAAAPDAAGASPRAAIYERLHGASSHVDQGEVLVFASDDLTTWRLQNRVSSSERFGFMWECPDFFEVSGARILSVSPQGLYGGEWEHRNLYQSGFFMLTGDLCDVYELGEFHLWDAGFDFYAPQTFEAEDGRRILIGWMGMPDDETYGNDPTVAEGWQHCFTVPREVTVGVDGVVRQVPVRELECLRGSARTATGSLDLAEAGCAFDLEVCDIETEFDLCLGGEFRLHWAPAADGAPAPFEMGFTRADRAGAGCGRTSRWELVEDVERVRVLVDTSSVEVFVNDGELVMSTRWYPERRSCTVEAPGAAIDCWDLDIA